MAASKRSQKRFEALCKIEPGLLELLNAVRAVKPSKRQAPFCANRVWYGRDNLLGMSFKDRMSQFVGWEALTKDPKLLTSEAYDAVYDVLYEALPDCQRGCGCA